MTVLPPGVRRVAVRTPTLPPATHTNCWLLGGERVTAVDPASPWVDGQEVLGAAVAGLRVERIVLTHHHPDHIGGAVDLRRRTGAPVLAHPETAARLPFPADGTIEDGEVIDTDAGEWAAIWTPGHAPGHLCLHSEPKGALVVGDMVAGEGTIVLDPPEGDLALYLDSLDRLARLDPRVLLPAHGPAIPEDAAPGAARAWLAYYVAHRRERTGQVRAALRARGTASPADLVPAVYADVPVAFHPIAARQVLCHLLWMRARGEVAGDDPFVLVEEKP